MGLLSWIMNSDQDEEESVSRYTIEDSNNGEWEFVGSDKDYQAILGDQEHTVLDEEPYGRKRLFGIF